MMTHSTAFGKAIVASLAAVALGVLCACDPIASPQQEFGWPEEVLPPPPTGAEFSLENTVLATPTPAPAAPESGAPVPADAVSAFAPVADFSPDNDPIVLEVFEGELEAPPPPATTETETPETETLIVQEEETQEPPQEEVQEAAAPQPQAAPQPEPQAELAAAPDVPPTIPVVGDSPQSITDDATEGLGDQQAKNSVRVALLLPFEAQERIATDMRNAAEMALFDPGMENITLIPVDTGGTTKGAREAMQEAIDSGADIILGPLLANSVRAGAPLAAENNLTLIAFSSDSSVLDELGGHVLLLNFPPEQDVERIIAYALEQDIEDYAALLPDTPYGERVRVALARKLALSGAKLHSVERYEQSFEGPSEPARRLAESGSPPPFKALLLAGEGQMLHNAAAMLAYSDIAAPDVQLLGTHLWDNPETFEDPSLQRGWYPMPHAPHYEEFQQRYERLYADTPHRRAALAYDAMSLVGLLAREGGDWRNLPAPPDFLLHPGGFAGVQGLFRFLTDGRSERAMAIWEIEAQGTKILQAARQSFDEGG